MAAGAKRLGKTRHVGTDPAGDLPIVRAHERDRERLVRSRAEAIRCLRHETVLGRTVE